MFRLASSLACRAGRLRLPLSPRRLPGAGPPFRPAPAATPSFLPARPIETWIEAHAKRQQQLSPCRPPFLLSPRAKRRAPAPLLPRAGGDRSPACAAEGRVRRRWLRTGSRGRGLDLRKERQARRSLVGCGNTGGERVSRFRRLGAADATQGTAAQASAEASRAGGVGVASSSLSPQIGLSRAAQLAGATNSARGGRQQKRSRSGRAARRPTTPSRRGAAPPARPPAELPAGQAHRAAGPP